MTFNISERRARWHAALLDADGTLLGAKGSIRHGIDGRRNRAALWAIDLLEEAGVERILMTGRNRTRTAALAEMLGFADTYIYELGCALMIDGEPTVLTRDPWRPRHDATVVEQMGAAGVAEFLIEQFPEGVLEPHTPWNADREFTLLLRGRLPVERANEVLAGRFEGLRLLDNGVIPNHMPAVKGPVHAYHVIPTGGGKAEAAALYRRVRGLRRESCSAVGDSPGDLEVAREVGTCYIVSNGPAHDARLHEALTSGQYPNAVVTKGACGQGVLEAVRMQLNAL